MRENTLSESEALRQLELEKWEFPPLKLMNVERYPEEFKPRSDWALDLRWKDRTERFVVEFKSPSTPKRLRDAAAQARAYAEAADCRPMVMGPYLDEDALDWLLEQDVSGIDFSGNGVVVVPGAWLVYRTGAPNAYPASQYIKSIYRGRSSQVGRALLLERRFDTVTAVQEEILRRGGRISLATVSKVLKSLEEELLVGRKDGVRLLQPEQLLDRLLESFERPTVGRRVMLRAPDPDQVAARMTSLAESQDLALAVRGDSAYTSFPGARRMLSGYTREFDELTSALDLPETRGFADLELLETQDELAFFDRRVREGVLWTSPLQVYLELATGDKREREVSEGLRGRLLAGELS